MRVGIAAIVVLAVGCSSSNTGDVGSAFSGSWKCTGSSTLSYTDPPGQPDVTKPSSDTILVTAGGDGTLTVATYVDAAASCTLKYTANGNDASLVSGQTCAPSGLTLTYVSGSAHVEGQTLTTTLRFSFTGAGAVGADGGAAEFTGTGTADSTCTR